MVSGGQAIELKPLPWDGPLALVLHVDALSVLFAFMGTCIGGLVLLYSIGYMAHEKSATRFFATMSIFIGGFIGLVYSANLFIFYIFWEMVGLCSFSLVGFWYTNPESVRGARKVLLMTHIAGYALLAAILVLYYRAGSAMWTDPAVQKSMTGGLFILMLIALVAKSVQVPLHTWIPEAMAAPTPVSALLHAACYVKAGVYLAARMHSFSAWPASWSLTMMWLGTVTMVVGVAYAMVQHDLKRMLAFHTVSQIGYIITGLGLGTPLGIAAGLLHCINHSLFKGGLFLAAGSVQHATGTRDMNKLGGLSTRMPRTTVVWMVSVCSMMGVPFLSGFASKWLLYTAALQAGQVVPALAAWVVSVGTVFSCVKATSTTFLGPTTAATQDAHEAPATMQWALGLFAAGSLVLGLAPQLAINGIINPILPLMGMSTVQVSWFGLTPAAGSWWTTSGLVMAIVSASVGVLFYLLAGVSRARALVMGEQVVLVGAGGGAFTGGESLNGPERLPASEFSVLLKKHWAPLYKATDMDRLYAGGWSVLQGVGRLLSRAITWIESSLYLWLLLLTGAFFFAVRGFHLPLALAQASSAEALPALPAWTVTAAAGALLLAAVAGKSARTLLPLLSLSALAAVSAAWTQQPFLRLALLECASLAAFALLWRTASRRAAWLYGGIVVHSAGLLIGGQCALQTQAPNTARVLLLTGFALKLALAPMLFWLPVLAEAAPALVTGLVIGVIDIVAFSEFALLGQSHPDFFQPRGFWIALALATSLIAALCMIAEANIKRLLALSTIEDLGFLTLGVVCASQLGMRGALLGAVCHALAKTLLFIAVSTPESDGALDGPVRGLATRYPFSAAGFLAGALAMLGVPPMLGFAGRWRLYQSALLIHPALLAAFIFCSMCALIAYVLCIARCWWGPWRRKDAPRASAEPLLLRMAIVLLMVVLLAGGLFPNVFLNLAGGAL